MSSLSGSDRLEWGGEDEIEEPPDWFGREHNEAEEATDYEEYPDGR